MAREIVEIVNDDNSVESVDLVTYLFSTDGQRQYIVYSKNEVQGNDEDYVIYISKVIIDGEKLKLEEIVEDSEWREVQSLLKRIANA